MRVGRLVRVSVSPWYRTALSRDCTHALEVFWRLPVQWVMFGLHRIGQVYPNVSASKLASRFITVGLAGGGGDKLLGGYPWRYYRTLRSRDVEDYVGQYYLFWQRVIPTRRL